MINTHNQMIANAFNTSSSTYNEHAHVQAAAGQALIQKIISIKNDFHNVLDAGCGTGITTEPLARRINFQKFYAVDIADTALSNAPSFNNRIYYKNLDFNYADSLPVKFDLIFSNMSLHWSRSFADTLVRFREAANDDGMLAFTIPLHGTFSEINDHFSIHNFFTSQQIADMLTAAGFHLIQHNEQIYRQTFPDAITALRSLKLTGVHHISQRRTPSLRGKAFLNSLSFNTLSYVNGFFIAEAKS